MKLASILTTLALGVAALSAIASTDAKLTTGAPLDNVAIIFVRRDVNAVAHATLETNNPKLIEVLESFVIIVENQLAAEKMDFDMYRTTRMALFDAYGTVVNSSRANDLKKRVRAVLASDAALNDLSLALYAPAEVSDVFFDLAEVFSNTTDDKAFKKLVKDERALVETKVKGNVNPVWVAAHLHGVLDDIRTLNASYASQLDTARAPLLRAAEEAAGL